jgi:hypothetical protein
VKEVFPAIAEMLEAAAQRIEDQRLWRGAWLDAEKRVDELTKEVDVLRSRRNLRKEKECND